MQFKLPKLGEGAESGTVVSILVKEGDRVKAGQTLLELENEKAVAPIPCPVAGVVERLHVKEGDQISVGQVIADIAEEGAAAAKPSKRAAQPAGAGVEEPSTAAVAEQEAPETEIAAAEQEADAEVLEAEEAPVRHRLPPAAAPSIRKLAKQLGIDLTRVKGSARGGRIVMADLKAYIERLQKLAFQAKRAPAPSRPAAAPAAPARQPIAIDFSKWGPVRQQPLSSLRQTISRRLSESWVAVPRVTQFDEADITALMELRKKYAAAYEKKGARLTLTSFALRAVVETLRKHPIFNASLDEAAQQIVFKEYYHIGLAVDTEQGLLVPVIRDVDRKSLLELSREVGELAEKARARKVSLEEMQGGTFTISNQGGIGGGHFTPVVNLPEVAILGLGRGAWKPVVREGKIEARLMLPLALSYDHRLIDGGTAARFIVDLVQAFEQFPESAVRLSA